MKLCLPKISLMVSLLAMSITTTHAMLIQHQYPKDNLPVFIYKLQTNGECGYNLPTYDESSKYKLMHVIMEEADSNNALQTFSSFRLGVAEDSAREMVCVRALYSTAGVHVNDKCDLGPIKNTPECKITFNKPGGNDFTPAIVENLSTFEACGIDKSKLVPFVEGAKPGNSCLYE